MKTFRILLGLAVFVLALWTVTTPVNAEAKSLFGGWDVTCPGDECYATGDDFCSHYEGSLPHSCEYLMKTPICLVEEDAGGECASNTGYTYDPCGDNCPGWPTGCTI